MAIDKIDASKYLDLDKARHLQAKLQEVLDYHNFHYTVAERKEPKLKRIIFTDISIAITDK